jgi:hypothetical protein
MRRPVSGDGSESADLVRTVLFGIDEGWFDAYWYGPQPSRGRHLLGRLVRGLPSLARCRMVANDAMSWRYSKARLMAPGQAGTQ